MYLDEVKIGQVVRLWAQAHQLVFILFVGFTKLPVKAAAATFYTLKADSLQRDITRNLGQAILSTIPDERKARDAAEHLKTTFAALNNLAKERNAITHGDIAVTGNGELLYSFFHQLSKASPKPSVLLDIDSIITRLQVVERDMFNLVNALAEALLWPETLLEP
jgi:hypothetical protein